jgi:hypothetical protein
MRFLTYTAIAILSFSTTNPCLWAQDTNDVKPETVRLGYELTLTSCKTTDCHTDSVAKGEADIVLRPQGADGAAGAQTVQMQAGGVNYTAVIKASSDTSSQGQGRHIDVTLTGEKSSGLSFQAHEAANCVAWDTLPLVTLATDPYTEDSEQVMPALHLKVITQ